MDWYAELKEDMNNHALRDYPREACGVILDDFTYKPCDNLSMEPALSFILDPAAFIKYDNNWGIFIHIQEVINQFQAKMIKSVLHFNSINF